MDLILANRALLDHHAPPGEAGVAATAAGGLVEAVRPVLVPWDGAAGTTWIGAGRGPHDRAWTDAAGFELIEIPAGPIRHQRLYFSEADWRGHYAEVANGFFWPLLHLVRVDLPQKRAYYPTPDPPTDDHWAAFERVNRAFAEAALAAGGGVCWVHDYQLALVPALLREGGFGGRTGFFLHTPFPSLAVAESSLPPPARARFAAWLAGILGADLAGVQTEADADRLREAAERLCGARLEGPDLRLNGRLVRIAAFPAGIDTEALARQAPESALPAAVPTTLPCPSSSASNAPTTPRASPSGWRPSAPRWLVAPASPTPGSRRPPAGASPPTTRSRRRASGWRRRPRVSPPSAVCPSSRAAKRSPGARSSPSCARPTSSSPPPSPTA